VPPARSGLLSFNRGQPGASPRGDRPGHTAADDSPEPKNARPFGVRVTMIHRLARLGRRPLRPLCLCVAAGSLAGCGDQSADVRAVNEAARELAGVSGSTPGAYDTVSASLSRVEVDRPTAEATVAGLLSHSLQGSGSMEIRAALDAERALTPRLAEAERLARRYAELATTADSLASFDPSEDLRRIAADARRLASETESVREARTALAARIGEKESRVASLESASSDLRNRAAVMKLESASASASEAARQATVIRGLSREADGLDMQANRLRGEIETIRPELAELEAEVAKLEEQRRLALESAEDLESLRAEWAERAVRARSEAATIANTVSALISSVAESRQASVLPAHEGAQTALERAIRSADQAARSDQATGRLAKAAAQRRLGEAHQLRSVWHARFASSLESIAATVPPLPQADEFRGRAADERAAEATQKTAAVAAYESAASAIRGSGVRGSARDQLEAAAAELDALIAGMSGLAPEAPTDDTEEPDGSDQP
jgi:prefoldin subunit 5